MLSIQSIVSGKEPTLFPSSLALKNSQNSARQSQYTWLRLTPKMAFSTPCNRPSSIDSWGESRIDVQLLSSVEDGSGRSHNKYSESRSVTPSGISRSRSATSRRSNANRIFSRFTARSGMSALFNPSDDIRAICAVCFFCSLVSSTYMFLRLTARGGRPLFGFPSSSAASVLFFRSLI